jgi:hypothetical protein
VASKGYLESVLDEALAETSGEYVLRLDDDEKCNHRMIQWLLTYGYVRHPHWKFSRAHLWTRDTVLVSPQLWPDHQTRLSVRAMAGGRHGIHAGSPYGGGELAPVLIEHHKFLVRNRQEREAQADRYDAIAPGAGRLGNMAMFQVPEQCGREFLSSQQIHLETLETRVWDEGVRA